MSRSRFVTARSVALTLAVLTAFSTSLLAAKDVFIRSKPHVNVGTIDGAPIEIWIHVEADLFATGKATGALQFSLSDGRNFFYRVISATAIIGGDDVIGLDIVIERVGDGGAGTGELDVVIVRRSTTIEECLIYDVLGANIRVEAEGTIELRTPTGLTP